MSSKFCWHSYPTPRFALPLPFTEWEGSWEAVLSAPLRGGVAEGRGGVCLNEVYSNKKLYKNCHEKRGKRHRRVWGIQTPHAELVNAARGDGNFPTRRSLFPQAKIRRKVR